MRLIDASNTIEILTSVERQLAQGEVLQIYPYPFLAQNGWFLQTMKVYNNYVMECILTELSATA